MWDDLYSGTVPGRLFLSEDTGSGRTLWQVAGLGMCVSVAPFVNVIIIGITNIIIIMRDSPVSSHWPVCLSSCISALWVQYCF